jgi:hypothetical protein
MNNDINIFHCTFQPVAVTHIARKESETTIVELSLNTRQTGFAVVEYPKNSGVSVENVWN